MVPSLTGTSQTSGLELEGDGGLVGLAFLEPPERRAALREVGDRGAVPEEAWTGPV